jgi:hypothetical protein
VFRLRNLDFEYGIDARAWKNMRPKGKLELTPGKCVVKTLYDKILKKDLPGWFPRGV